MDRASLRASGVQYLPSDIAGTAAGLDLGPSRGTSILDGAASRTEVRGDVAAQMEEGLRCAPTN